MENYPVNQMMQALSAVLFGGSLGFLYDLLRAIRRRTGRLTWLLDLMFCAMVLFLLFYLGMSIGAGQLRVFMGLFVGFGFFLYLFGLSPLILPLLLVSVGFLYDMLIYPINLAKKCLKKVYFFLKRLFQYAGKWFKINYNFILPARENPRSDELSEEVCLRGTQNKYYGKDDPSVRHGLRDSKPYSPER